MNDNNAALTSLNQTIPTRTSTPGPGPGPTNPPAPTSTKSDDGGSATAVPTSTSQSLPTNTSTPTPIITIAFTPAGGFVPTAEPCSSQPTIQVKNPTNVRQGPGTNYPIVGQLVYLEVRFILGRAADAAWWLILLDDGKTGWVADNVVTVQGYTGVVPVVPAPKINGQMPTPGTPWNPTPPPFCTVTPTATAAATAVPSITPSPTTIVSESAAAESDPQLAAELSITAISTGTSTDMLTDGSIDTPVPLPTQTAVAPPTLPPIPSTNQPEVNQPEVIDAVQPTQPTVEPTKAASLGSTTDWLLPLAGLLLIAGGVTAFVTRRKR